MCFAKKMNALQVSKLQGVAISQAEREGFPSLTSPTAQHPVSRFFVGKLVLLFRVFVPLIELHNLLQHSDFLAQCSVFCLQIFEG